MGVPDAHRAYHVLKTDELVKMSHSHDLHASYQQWLSADLNSTGPVMHGEMMASGKCYSEMVAARVIKDCTMSRGRYGTKRTELMEGSFTVLEGVLQDSLFQGRLEHRGVYGTCVMDEVLAHAEHLFKDMVMERSHRASFTSENGQKISSKRGPSRAGKMDDMSRGGPREKATVQKLTAEDQWTLVLNKSHATDAVKNKTFSTRYISNRRMYVEAIESEASQWPLVRYKDAT